MTRYSVCGECGKAYRGSAGSGAAAEPTLRLHEVVSHAGRYVEWRVWGIPGAEDRPRGRAVGSDWRRTMEY